MVDRSFAAWLTDVPDLDTTFASSVNKLGRVGHGNSADNFTVMKGVDLSGMARDAWSCEGIWRK